MKTKMSEMKISYIIPSYNRAKEIIKTRNRIINFYVEATGKDFDSLEKVIDRDSWMSAEEAIEFGLIDKIITSYSEI